MESRSISILFLEMGFFFPFATDYEIKICSGCFCIASVGDSYLLHTDNEFIADRHSKVTEKRNQYFESEIGPHESPVYLAGKNNLP